MAAVRIDVRGRERRILTFGTRAGAAEYARQHEIAARGMKPLRAEGRFAYFWILAEVTRWNESTLTVRWLGPGQEALTQEVLTEEVERPAGFVVPHLVTPSWAARQSPRASWILRGSDGVEIDAFVLGVDGDYVTLRIAAGPASGRVVRRFLATIAVVRRAHEIQYSSGSAFATDNGVDRWCGFLYSAYCSCGTTLYQGGDEQGRRFAVRGHLDEMAVPANERIDVA